VILCHNGNNLAIWSIGTGFTCVLALDEYSGPAVGMIRPREKRARQWRLVMLYWAAVFFIIALVATILAIGGIAGAAASIAQVLFITSLVIFVVSLLLGIPGGRRMP